MNIQNLIAFKVKEGFLRLYQIEIPTVEFQATRKEFEGDITVVVFPLLKYKKGNPAEIGENLGKYLSENVPEIKKYNVVQGFLNLVIDDVFISIFLIQSSQIQLSVLKFQRKMTKQLWLNILHQTQINPYI